MPALKCGESSFDLVVRPHLDGDDIDAQGFGGISAPRSCIRLPGLSGLNRKLCPPNRNSAAFSSSTRFPASSCARLASPVMFPPGCARLATNPCPTGSAISTITIGIGLHRLTSRRHRRGTASNDHLRRQPRQFRRERRKALNASIPPADGKFEIIGGIAKRPHSLPERIEQRLDKRRARWSDKQHPKATLRFSAASASRAKKISPRYFR